MKTKLLTLCGLALTSAAYAQPGTPQPQPTPPADPPTMTDPDAQPPAPAPVVVQTQPAPTTVVVAPAPQHTDDGEIDETYRNAGLLFDLNDIFTQPDVLGGWQGFGLGVQKQLGSGSVVRVGLTLGRQTDPVDIVKTTRTEGGMEVVSYDLQLPGSGYTSQHAIAAVADMVKPLTNRPIAPYLGAGVFAAFSTRHLSYTDDLTVTDQVTEVANSSSSFSIGVRGILGVAWRMNDRFSLFAEYQLGLNAISWQSDHTQTTTNNTASGGTAASSRVETDFKETRWFNLNMGLAQGGALGLVAHF